MVVKYQVERRPISANGKVYRGSKSGDYVFLPSDPERLGAITAGGAYLGSGAGAYPPGAKLPELGSSIRSHFVEVNGEPWVVHSTHFSVDSATESAAPLASAIGAENVRIIQVLSHKTVFKLN